MAPHPGGGAPMGRGRRESGRGGERRRAGPASGGRGGPDTAGFRDLLLSPHGDDRQPRGARDPSDRGGGRLVRAPRGDPRAVGRPVRRGRAVGLGALEGASPAHPCPAREACSPPAKRPDNPPLRPGWPMPQAFLIDRRATGQFHPPIHSRRCAPATRWAARAPTTRRFRLPLRWFRRLAAAGEPANGKRNLLE